MAASDYNEWGRCRFCGVSARHLELVHYAVRHWAHPVCLYRRKGIEAINALHTWQIRRLPVLAMMEAGVTLDQVRGWQARIDAEDRELQPKPTAATSPFRPPTGDQLAALCAERRR